MFLAPIRQKHDAGVCLDALIMSRHLTPTVNNATLPTRSVCHPIMPT